MSRKHKKKLMLKGPIETNQMSIEAAPDSIESMIVLYQEKKEVSKISANFEQSRASKKLQ